VTLRRPSPLFTFRTLIFAPLHLDYSVDDWGSRSGTHLGAQNGAVAFATTHWSIVLEAQSQSPAAQEALEKLCRTYWRPVYSFIRRQGTGSEEAEDLTQGFLHCCWSGEIWRLFAGRKVVCALICLYR